MKLRTTCVGICLLFLGSWQVRAGLHGAAFVYKQINGDVGLFQPMVTPKIAVQLMKGPQQINRGEVLVCKQGTETRKVDDHGQEVTVTELSLTCGERVFIVKGILFEEQ